MQKETLVGVATGSLLSPGAVVSGRFLVEGLCTMCGAIPVYNAKDQRTQRAVALWALPRGLVPVEAVAAIRAAVKTATTVTHKNLVMPFGSSADATGTVFVATEPLGGTSAAEMIAKKRAEGHVHGLQAAYQLLAHVMNGLHAAHSVLAHGAISPQLLRVDAEGVVKVAGLGLGPALIAAGVTKPEYVAPEIRNGGAATPRADVYSLGAILYELCTGKTPDPSVPASSVVPGLPATFDIIIENCLAESPDDRFESVTEIKGALASLVAPSVHPPPASEGLDVPIEFDETIDVEAAIAAAPPKRLTIPPAPAPAPATPRLNRHPAAPPPPSTAAYPAANDANALTEVDLKSLLAQATADDAQRWMFVRGGLDHGPFTARELIQAIVRNEVLEDDVVFNMDTGERRKLIEWPQYRDFAEQARDKRKREQHDREVRGAIAEESVNTKAKAAVAIALVAALAGLSVVYVKTLSPAARQASRQREFDDMIARGQLRVAEGTLEVLPPPPAPAAGSTRARSSGGGAYMGSYEAAMNQPIEYNFGGAMGGSPLSDAEIAAPLNRSLGRFASCATAEMARGGNARDVRMRIAVGNSGSAIGVTVLNGSGAFRSCVASVVRSIHWRPFGGPRIGFAWGFSLQ